MSERNVYYLIEGSEGGLGVQVSDIQQQFVSAIQTCFPNNPVEFVPRGKIRNAIRATVKELSSSGEVFVVSLSRLYYPNADDYIDCNRIVSKDGSTLGIGPRPKTYDLSVQVKSVMDKADGRVVVVVDDTLFHGESIRGLRALGLEFDTVVVYFADRGSSRSLTEQGYTVHASLETAGYLDVLPVHDFLPFVPLCGKVVGKSVYGKPSPIVVPPGVSLSLPYIIPFILPEQVHSWASIPLEHVQEYSEFALGQTMELFRRLKGVGVVSIADYIHSNPPRRSLPMSVGLRRQMFESLPIDYQEPILDYLGRTLHAFRG